MILVVAMMLIMVLIMAICMASPTTVTRSVIALIIVIPMPPIPKNRLAVIAIPILNIPGPVYIMTHPGTWVVDHHLIPPVQVITAASGR